MGPVCQIFHAAIELIGRRWSGAILWALGQAPCRFSDFREAIPDISDRLLSERLKELEDAGLIVRVVNTSTRPVQVLYRLTPKGEELQPLMAQIGVWAAKWAQREAEAAS